MTSGVPWQVEGIRQQARETAREAARRSGMSVGEWLDSVISDRAKDEGAEPTPPLQADDDDAAADIDERPPPGRHGYADCDDHHRRTGAEDIAEARGRRGEVARWVDQLSRLNATQAYLRPDLLADEPPRELADVIWRLDRRLDQLIASGRLTNEAGELAAKVDQIASSADLLSTLEHRISSMAEALEARRQVGATVASDLDAVVKGPADRLERLGFTRSDQAAVGQLEDRITNLLEKLDTSNARLDHLETIERMLTDLVANLERQPDVECPAAPASPDIASLRLDVRETQNSLETVQGVLGHLIDRLAMIENDMRSASPVPAAGALADGPAARAAARHPAPPAQHEHGPIDPNLPPDHPLEPGAVRRHTGNPPVDRIAASAAALGPPKPPVLPQPGNKSDFIAAARRAARAANSEDVVRGDKPAPAPTTNQSPQGKAAGGRGDRVRSLLVAVSVVLIVLSSLPLVASLFSSSGEPGDGSGLQETRPLPKGNGGTTTAETPDRSTTDDDPAVPGAKMPAAPAPGRQSLIVPTDSETLASTPAGVSPATTVAAEKDVTGSISRPTATPPAMPAMSASEPAPASLPHGTRATSVDKLPAAIGGALRAAAAKGDAAAEYEIAQRYAEGRGVPQNLAEAADWFDRAAKQGLAPAQFRLGGFYEKGLGVKKDLDAAQRLYSAAAEAGNAKAMHNLAVLYAEGIDGKPDYQNAAKWFRKAADCGLTDSQYNLGILYGRGIGMEPNLAAAYKWFALAARDGDKESAAKRDDVGGRLDPQSLAAAKLAAQAWTPLEQPEAAIQAPVPAGGWDNVAALAPGNPKPRTPWPMPDRSTPPAGH